MWISQLRVFDVENAAPEEWEAAFAELELADPEGGNRATKGFHRPEAWSAMVDRVGSMYAFVGATATRVLPKDAVDREMKKRMTLQGHPDLSKQATDQAWSELEASMLPSAPIKEVRTPAVYCADRKMLYVFGSTTQGIEALQQSIREAVGSFAAVPMRPRIDVAAEMTRWVIDHLPEDLELGDFAVTGYKGEAATTTFRKQEVTSEIVQKHLEEGEQLLKLQLEWKKRLTFELNDRGEIKKLGPPGNKMKPGAVFEHWPEVMAVLPDFVESIRGCIGAVAGQDVALDPEDTTGMDRIKRALVIAESDDEIALTSDSLHRLIGMVEEIVLVPRKHTSSRAIYAWARERGRHIEITQTDLVTEEMLARVMSSVDALCCYGSDRDIKLATRTAVASGMPIVWVPK